RASSGAHNNLTQVFSSPPHPPSPPRLKDSSTMTSSQPFPQALLIAFTSTVCHSNCANPRTRCARASRRNSPFSAGHSNKCSLLARKPRVASSRMRYVCNPDILDLRLRQRKNYGRIYYAYCGQEGRNLRREVNDELTDLFNRVKEIVAANMTEPTGLVPPVDLLSFEVDVCIQPCAYKLVNCNECNRTQQPSGLCHLSRVAGFAMLHRLQEIENMARERGITGEPQQEGIEHLENCKRYADAIAAGMATGAGRTAFLLIRSSRYDYLQHSDIN
ncbi:hypothetical protein BCR34DRAFT_647526, partial [Clohesyomyces aquaticus]